MPRANRRPASKSTYVSASMWRQFAPKLATADCLVAIFDAIEVYWYGRNCSP